MSIAGGFLGLQLTHIGGTYPYLPHVIQPPPPDIGITAAMYQYSMVVAMQCVKKETAIHHNEHQVNHSIKIIEKQRSQNMEPPIYLQNGNHSQKETFLPICLFSHIR